MEEVLGVEGRDVRGLRLINRKTGERSELAVEFMLFGVGHEPNTRMFEGHIDVAEDGYIKTASKMQA